MLRIRQKNVVENANQNEPVYQMSCYPILCFPVVYHLDSFITSVLYANLLTFFRITVFEGVEADGMPNRQSTKMVM